MTINVRVKLIADLLQAANERGCKIPDEAVKWNTKVTDTVLAGNVNDLKRGRQALFCNNRWSFATLRTTTHFQTAREVAKLQAAHRAANAPHLI